MSITLGYWNFQGRAEPLRWLLHYLKIPYTEVNYSMGNPPKYDKSAWLKAKYSLGFDYPNLPYIQDGDFRLTELSAICKYLCMKHKPEMLGKTLQDQATCEMTMGVLYDFRRNLLQPFRKRFGGEESSKEAEAAMFATILNLNDVLSRRTYLVGEYLTYVDLIAAQWLECVDYGVDKIFERYPHLKRHYDLVANLEGVKAFREGRKGVPYQEFSEEGK